MPMRLCPASISARVAANPPMRSAGITDGKWASSAWQLSSTVGSAFSRSGGVTRRVLGHAVSQDGTAHAAFEVKAEVIVLGRIDAFRQQDEGVELMFMARPRAEHRVMIHIATQDELPRSYADELRAIVREQMDDPEVTVNVVAVRGLWRSDEDSRP